VDDPLRSAIQLQEGSAPRAGRPSSENIMTDIALDLLARVRIASPCPMRWEDMTGDEKKRHCAQCNLSVYNLSAMTRAEAESLLASKRDGRMCAGFYRRADGTVLTRDCPVGLAAAKERVRRAVARVAAALGLVVAGGSAAGAAGGSWSGLGSPRLRAFQPFAILSKWLMPAPPPPPPGPPGPWIAGDICIPTPAPAPRKGCS
jgi:hypothetical protein